MVLFNTHRYRADAEPPNLADMDAVPGPMPAPRLTEGPATGNPGAYVRVTTYSDPSAAIREAVGLTLHVPASLPRVRSSVWPPHAASKLIAASMMTTCCICTKSTGDCGLGSTPGSLRNSGNRGRDPGT